MPARLIAVRYPPRLCAPRAGIAVAYVEPERAVCAQHTAGLAKHPDHRRDVLVRRHLEAKLAGDAIITEAEIGRAGDAAMHDLGRQLRDLGQRIAGDDADAHPGGESSGWSRVIRTTSIRSSVGSSKWSPAPNLPSLSTLGCTK